MEMTLRLRAVSVKHLPEKVDTKQLRDFFRELADCMSGGRPCIVLDFSQLRQMDRAAIQALLYCLEEAMKCNGDVRLAAVSPDAQAMLSLTGVDRLFQMFDTNQEAIDSFHRRHAVHTGFFNQIGSMSLEATEAAA